MAEAIFGAFFPVFALTALGYLVGRRSLLGEGADAVLNRFVGQLTLPVLTFHTLAQMDARDLAVPAMGLTIVGSSYIVYAIYFAWERGTGKRVSEANITALCASFGNSAFVGLPVCLALFGRESLGPSAVVIALNTAFVFGGAVLVSVLARDERRSIGKSLLILIHHLGTNSLILGGIGGVTIALLGWQFPDPLDVALSTLGGATGPCALIAIGMFISHPVEQVETSLTIRAAAGKLVLHPLVVVALLAILPALPPVWAGTVIVMAAMPTGASSFVVAASAGVRGLRISARLIVLTTLAAIVTLSLTAYLVGRAGFIAIEAPAPLP